MTPKEPAAFGPGPTPNDWSCPHGGRWIGWPGGWMQVAAPMTLNTEGYPEALCHCEPPYPGPKQAVAPRLGEGPQYEQDWDEETAEDEDEYEEEEGFD